MSLQYYLRLALVGLTLSVVGCLPDMSIGDIMDDSKIKTPALENFRSVHHIQNQMTNTLHMNAKQFNRKYQLPWINSALYNLRNDGNPKNPGFSPTDTRASANVTYKVQSKVNSRNNPVELSSVTFNDGTDAKRSYALQTVQQERNPSDFKGSQMRSSDINLSLGQVSGMHAANVYRSGSFGYQHTSKSKSEMRPDSSQPLGLNEPYLRENIPINYMSRSSTVNHMRHKSDGNMLFNNFLQNNGRNQNMLKRVVLANTSPSVVKTNQQERKPLPQAFSSGTGVTSRISYENMRDVALSKVFKPPTIPTPISPAFKSSNSNRGHSILPLKKSLMFSSQQDHAELSNSERPASPKANPRSSFDYGNTKSATSSYTFKDIQLTSTQNGYQNQKEGSQNVAPVHNENKYDILATSISAIRPSVTNARSYFLSDENSGTQMFALLNRSKQNTDLTPRMQFAKNTKLISERNTNINLPNSTNHSLMKPSQHTIRNRTALNSFGQSTVQLSVKHYPAPSLVPSNAMKTVHSSKPSVSGTQGTSKNSDTSSSQNRPYYLTSKKPYAFKGFSFFPTLQTSLQKTEMHSIPNSSPNVQYAAACPRTALSALAQKPFIQERNEKTLLQYKDIETSQDKQPYRDQTDSFDNGPQRGTVFSTEGASNHMSVVRGQAVVMKTSLSGTNATNNGAVDVVKSKTSQRWTSNRLISAQHTESDQYELPNPRSLKGKFVGSNSYEAFIKSINPTSELILPIHKASLFNKVTEYSQINNAVIQPLRRYSLKEHKRLLNPTSKEINDRTTAGIAQSNVTENYSPIKLRQTSSVVIGRQVEMTPEGKRTEENSNQQNIYAIPNSQFAIYRSADVNTSAKHTFQSPIHRSAMKPFGKANILQANAVSNWRNETSLNSETDIDLNAVGVSQASRPTSSFVVAKYINTSDKAKSNLIMSSTKTVLNNYKPVRFSDVAGSASFTNVKPRSADTTAKENLTSDQNGSNSTPVMEESFKRGILNSSFMISGLQNEIDESAVDSSVPELMPTPAIDFTTESQMTFTEEYTQPQPTVYSFQSQLDPGDHTPTEEGIYQFYEVTLIPNNTLLIKMTSG
ncbi:hypothetical protein Q8A67_001925 [Cirrhinus molitorella]|uniref:Uncharacterized protein n=1 Tax=Cirrhinus molitorella TaxID=172907 RepID=A0AA88U5J0_9TELE|nr:hypothetical protein Q8A67_001925 [Cirrhinus molitorella]